MEKNKGRKNILKSSLAVLLIIAGLVSFAGCAKEAGNNQSDSGQTEPVTILNVSYDPTVSFIRITMKHSENTGKKKPERTLSSSSPMEAQAARQEL